MLAFGYVVANPSAPLRKAAELASELLVKAGVRFTGSAESAVLWLVAVRPFALGAALYERLECLGEAVLALLDATQDLYAAGNPIVRGHLDTGVRRICADSTSTGISRCIGSK